MNWNNIATVIALLGALVLLGQGIAILIRPSVGYRQFGLLAILLAITALIWDYLFFNRWLVLGREFGVVMVQGGWAWYGLVTMLAGLVAAASLAPFVLYDAVQAQAQSAELLAQMLNKPIKISKVPWWQWLVLAVAVAVFLFTVGKIEVLNPAAHEQLRVYVYKLYSPVLMLWLIVCLVGSVFAMLNYKEPRLLLALSVTVFACLSALLYTRASDIDRSRNDWLVAIMIFCGMVIGYYVWLWLRHGTQPSPARPQLPQRQQQRLIIFLFVVIVLSFILLFYVADVPAALMIIIYLLAWILLAGVVAGSLTRQVRRLRKLAARQSTASPVAAVPAATAPADAAVPVAAVPVAVVPVAAVPAATAPADAAAPVAAVPVAAVAAATAPADAAAPVAATPVAATPVAATPVAAPADAAVPASGSEKADRGRGGLFGLFSTSITVMKVLFVIVLFIALSEVTNIGKTLVQPFTVPEDGDDQKIGKALRDQVVSNIGLLALQLRPDIILPVPGSKSQAGVQYISAEQSTTDLNLKFEDNDYLSLGGFSLPIKLLVRPIQIPMRELLRVRTVSGNMLNDRTGTTLIVSADRGSTWSAQFPPKMIDLVISEANGAERFRSVPLVLTDTLHLPPSADFTTAVRPFPGLPLTLPMTRTIEPWLLLNQSGTPVYLARAGTGPLTITVAPWVPDALVDQAQLSIALNSQLIMANTRHIRTEDIQANLAQELAFNIVSQSSELQATGMTDSWPAFKVFQQGLESWERFQAGDQDALTTAIRKYRAAIQRDPSFALAYYRLGLALQQDGQPGAAAAAFRSAVRAAPHFVAAHNALAFHLLDFDWYYQLEPAAPAAAHGPSEPEQKTTRLHEARSLWQLLLTGRDRTLTDPDAASAYYGLCLSSYYDGLAKTADIEQNEEDAKENKTGYETKEADEIERRVAYDLAYFYCQRAELFYMAMSRADRSETRVKQAEASVLNLLGIVVEVRDQGASEIVQAPDQEDPEIGSTPFAMFESGAVYVGTTERFWHCTDDIVRTLTPDGNVETIEVARSARPDLALHYYQRALALQPDDPIIRCNAANVDFARERYEPMRTLFEDAASHLELAAEFRRRVRAASGDDEKHAYHLRSLREYEAVIGRNPTDIDALNGYAYTFWHWGLHGLAFALPSNICRDGAREDGMKEICDLSKARSYAERAVRLASAQGAQDMEAIVRSTHGEILLMEGQAVAALRELEYAYALAPGHPFSDEIRWELAQARLCTTSMSLAKAYDGEIEAAPLLAQIRWNEALREHRPFTDGPPRLLEAPTICDQRVKDIIQAFVPLRESLWKAYRP